MNINSISKVSFNKAVLIVSVLVMVVMVVMLLVVATLVVVKVMGIDVAILVDVNSCHGYYLWFSTEN